MELNSGKKEAKLFTSKLDVTLGVDGPKEENGKKIVERRQKIAEYKQVETKSRLTFDIISPANLKKSN